MDGAVEGRRGGRRGGREPKEGEEDDPEEHHQNPFLSSSSISKPSPSRPQFRFLAEKGGLVLDDNGTHFGMEEIYKKIAEGKYGCSWEFFEAYKHLKSLGYIVGRHGLPWTMKQNCHVSSILPSTENSNQNSDREVEDNIVITDLLKGMHIDEIYPAFDIYLPNSKFRKSSPGNPSFILCLLRDKPPSRKEVETLEKKCSGIPLKFCYVDHGRVSFFSFDKVMLPSLP
ncbi:uncharacterized protein [Typha angustifolia]|uniref:uncharacterized protein isoform X4 n=1 Tax=Typha angustifolia TaxID=59011 RepID=UPI003C30E968